MSGTTRSPNWSRLRPPGYLAEALGAYTALGATWDVERACARLRPYGVRPRRADPARPVSGWEALTPTEVKVAYLVAEGRSNPDVAAVLFLSRYTVQSHVSNILGKLGVRSRAEIILEAVRHPRPAGEPEGLGEPDRGVLGDPVSL